ncbi:DUF4097 family beta strand repeat-containing protein [Chloroflexota bacterium]
MTVEIIEKTFTCSESPVLTLSNIRGSVLIQPGQNGQITVIASKKVKSGDSENTRVELSQSADGSVNASTHYDKSGIRFLSTWRPCKVDYDVRVPEDCSLKIRGVSNSAVIEGISGRMDLSTVSGDLDCRSLSGELKVKALSGDVSGESLSGPIQLWTVSGDIRLTGCDFPSLKGKTVSGDILIETPLGDGPYNFNAVSGDIKLEIPPSTGVTIHSTSLSGDIRTNSQISTSNHSRNNRKVEVQGGGVEIHHHSVSGDLFLVNTKGNDASLIPQEDNLDQNSSLTRSEILDRIAIGELSTEEALRLFDEQAQPS